MRRLKGFWSMVVLAPATMLGGCESPTEPAWPTTLPDVSMWTVGRAAAALDAEGHFVLPSPVQPTEGMILNPEDAIKLGRSYIDTYVTNPQVVGNLRQKIEERHGGPIDWDRLQGPDRPAYYGSSPYVVPEDLSADIRNHYGPKYLIPYSVAGDPVMVESVAGFATYLDVGADGFLRNQIANEFRTLGLPRGIELTVPLAPEHAVESAASRTGVKVTEVPRYILPAWIWPAWEGYWKIVLEDVRQFMDYQGNVSSTDTVYVRHAWFPDGSDIGMTADFFVAAEQPECGLVQYAVHGEEGEVSVIETCFPLNSEAPLVMSPVVPY